MGSLDDYEVLEEIGKGSFGMVSRIKRKSDSKTLVWKALNYGKMTEKEKQLLVSEVNILRELRHPNIVRYYDRIIVRETKMIYIVMECCNGGDVAAMIQRCRKQRKYIEMDVVWKIFSQVVLALSECHNRKEGKILHRDLKPGNIFLDSEQNAKLGDFGLARVMGSHSLYAKTYVGTPYYMSPEQIRDQPYDERSDIWSLGCLMFEMCALVPPFDASNPLALAVKIKSGQYGQLPPHCGKAFSDVIARMLVVLASKRPSIGDLVKNRNLSLVTRELEVAKRHALLKRGEEELEVRERAVASREQDLAAREEAAGVTADASKLPVAQEEGISINDNGKGKYRLRSATLGAAPAKPPRQDAGTTQHSSDFENALVGGQPSVALGAQTRAARAIPRHAAVPAALAHNPSRQAAPAHGVKKYPVTMRRAGSVPNLPTAQQLGRNPPSGTAALGINERLRGAVPGGIGLGIGHRY